MRLLSEVRTLKNLVLLCLALFSTELRGQRPDSLNPNIESQEILIRQDTALEKRKRGALALEPDTNFTFEKYRDFLISVSDQSKYLVLPLDEFRTTFDNNKIVIGLRHDVDNSLSHAFDFSETEWNLGVRSTYFILHTASYYLKNAYDKSVHNESILPALLIMQNERDFEIGWHNDLVTLQLIYNIDPVSFLKNELAWLRSNNLYISGTASHGSPYCHDYYYLNYYFFEECSNPPHPAFLNNTTVNKNGMVLNLQKGKLSDFNLNYEAYFLNNNKYYSDASITNGVRWSTGMLDLSLLNPGDRVIILLHPVHWHKASIATGIQEFSITGQKSSIVDPVNNLVTITMPYGTDVTSLKPAFRLSPGAQAKINGVLQKSGYTRNSFLSPIAYRIYAENRDIQQVWTVRVTVEKNSASEILSFDVPGSEGTVHLDSPGRSIILGLPWRTDLTAVPVSFVLSPGARIWIGDVELNGNSGIIDLSNDAVLRVVADDGISMSIWNVGVSLITGSSETRITREEFRVYPNPSEGVLHLQFRNAVNPPRIEVFNFRGEKIYSGNFNKTGFFSVEIDLTGEMPGLYIVRNLSTGQRTMVVIQ